MMKYGVPSGFEDELAEALDGLELGKYGMVDGASTYEEQGMMTMNAGVTLDLACGVSVTLTINTYDGTWPEDKDEDEEV